MLNQMRLARASPVFGSPRHSVIRSQLSGSGSCHTGPHQLSSQPSSSLISRRALSQSFATLQHQPQPQNPNSSPKPSQNQNPSIETRSFKSLFKELKGPTRWIVFAGIGLLVTAETTFWIQVTYAKFFAKDDEAADEFLERVREGVIGYRHAWLPNYWRYYGGTMWGWDYR